MGKEPQEKYEVVRTEETRQRRLEFKGRGENNIMTGQMKWNYKKRGELVNAVT